MGDSTGEGRVSGGDGDGGDGDTTGEKEVVPRTKPAPESSGRQSEVGEDVRGRAEQARIVREWERKWKKGGDWKAGMDVREVERMVQEWERKWKQGGDWKWRMDAREQERMEQEWERKWKEAG